MAQIITFGTLAARAVIRDVGRVLSMPLREVDRIAKMIPSGPGVTLRTTLERSKEFAELYASDSNIHRLIDHCLDLEGLSRNSGNPCGRRSDLFRTGRRICSYTVDPG